MRPKCSWSAAASVSCQARHILPASGTLRARYSRWLRCPQPSSLVLGPGEPGTGNRAPPPAAAPGSGLEALSRGPPGSAAASSSLVADRAAARHGGPKRRCLPWRAPRFPEVPGLPLGRHPPSMGYFINPSISPAVPLPLFLIILRSLMINLFLL